MFQQNNWIYLKNILKCRIMEAKFDSLYHIYSLLHFKLINKTKINVNDLIKKISVESIQSD